MGKLKCPRATTAERTSITPDASELIYDTDLSQFYYGDGSTVGGLPIGAGGSFEDTFVSGDWNNTGDYEITINHALNTTTPVVEIYEADYKVEVNNVLVVDANNLKLIIPSDPDLRFDGKVKVVK